MALHSGRIFLVTMALFVTSACDREEPVAKAEREFELVQESKGDNFELCEAARKVEQAALEAEDREKHEWWSMLADSQCLHAELLGGHS